MIGIYIKVNDNALGKEEIQLKACKSLLSDGDKFEIYSDLGNTRVARDQMINDIKNGKITKVITYNFSRLTRKHEEIMEIVKLLKTTKIELVTYEEGEINNSMFSIAL